ncbi:MAG TPA: hypothetical protein DER02_11415 [Gammaproteobacteria bacterium]|nr:hypothetical protein [Gammaproteobacteria bacterium]|tara:strand:- start:784 stop:993 length:210 start_codon:yes stop_codon:yes gene_type:complete
MYICLCSGVTDQQIREAVKAGANELHDLQRSLGVSIGCGTCAEAAMQIIGTTLQDSATQDLVARLSHAA